MKSFALSGNPSDIALGNALLEGGRVGCIVLAGGDGSRLGWEGPKGTFPLSLVKQKSLFQLLSERVQAAREHYKANLPFAVMTSPLNHEVTRAAFAAHLGQIDFFEQRMVPLLDEEKNPLKEERPNGNGEVFHQFIAAGLLEKWKAQGVEYIQTIQIDNPLAEPFDPNQIGIHFKTRVDVVVKAVKRECLSEKVGVIGKKEGKLCVIEYSENPPDDWKLANTSLFSFSVPFIEKIQHHELPIHAVKKHLGGTPVFKRETFLFDLLPLADKAEVLLCPRSEIFAPLKSREDVGAVQRALLERDKRAFHSLTGKTPHDQIFELHPTFHFPTDEHKQKWKGKELPDSTYIAD